MASLHYKYSTMNAGKSTDLIQTKYNYEERGMSCLVLTPRIDDRYGVGQVTSRVGLKIAAITIPDSALEMEHLIEDWAYNIWVGTSERIGAVLVDEAQFLSKEHVYSLAKVVDRLNIPVVCYGLRTDFRGELFEGSYHLLALANKLEELKTICHCGRKATMVARVDESGKVVKEGPQVQIGGNDVYVSLCRHHWMLGQIKPISEPTI